MTAGPGSVKRAPAPAVSNGGTDMPVRKYVTTIMGAAALALGLAACGGGGGGSSNGSGSMPDEAAIDRAVALRAAIEAAATTAAGGGFDDTLHGVAPVVTAAHDATGVSVEVAETGTPRGGAARAGAFAIQSSGPRPIAGWPGARFRRGEATEHLVVYTDVGAPEAAAFTPENLNRLREVSGQTGETVPASGLAIESGWYPVIRSTSLAAAPANGSVTHQAEGTGANAGLEFVGSFGGGSGAYRCSGSACSVTLDDAGAPTAMGGDWVFAPDSAAKVMIPDYEHLYFGWWLNETDGEYGFQSFAGAAGFAAGSGNVEAAMEGTATYRGAAAGVWATVDSSGGRITDARAGEFTAEATLTANFFGALDAGAVSGEIGSFRDGAGRAMAGWRVTLSPALLSTGEAGFAGATGGTVGAGTSGAGRWHGRFHGTDGAETNPRPSHAAGRFDLHFPGAHIAGAFGAGK